MCSGRRAAAQGYDSEAVSRPRCCIGSVQQRGEIMVGAFTKFSCSRPSYRPQHRYFLEERISWNRISPAASVHGVPHLEAFEAVEHPSEPIDVDQPAQCPPPERCIMRDGLIWKEMLVRRQRETQSKVWQEGDPVSGIPPPRRRIHNSPREKYLFITHSAPERLVSRIRE